MNEHSKQKNTHLVTQNNLSQWPSQTKRGENPDEK